jgi:DNA-binding GntR family transcriptional regulator
LRFDTIIDNIIAIVEAPTSRGKLETTRNTARPAPARRDRAATDPVQDLVRHIEEDIVFRVLHPRQRLVEDELMERFGAKRHVVRQALVELERSGFVQRKRNSGAQVRALSAKEVNELYDVREILETSCARLVPMPVERAKLAPIEAIQREHAAAVRRRDARAVLRANLAFHEAVFRLSGNDALVDAIFEYARRTHPVRLTTLVTGKYLEQARDEHAEMLTALRKGQREKMLALCARHLRPSREAYIASAGHIQ